MSLTSRNRFGLTAAYLAASLLLVSCGGGEGSSSAPSPSAAGPTPAVATSAAPSTAAETADPLDPDAFPDLSTMSQEEIDEWLASMQAEVDAIGGGDIGGPKAFPSPYPSLPQITMHADEGEWAAAGYEGGNATISRVEDFVDLVGRSADGKVFAYGGTEGIVGISVATGEQVWTYPAHGCSEGTWNGIALCGDSMKPGELVQAGKSVPMVFLDLGTGKVTAKITGMELRARTIRFVAADDKAGYFSINNFESDMAFGEVTMLAINAKGQGIWLHRTGVDHVATPIGLVAGNRVAIMAGTNGVYSFDRATGEGAASNAGGRYLASFYHDVYSGISGLTPAYFDYVGNEVSDPGYTASIVPSRALPALADVTLEGDDFNITYAYGPDGTFLLQSDPASFSSNPALVAKNGTTLPEGDIETISVDGKVVVYTDGKLFSGETAEEIPGFRAAGVGDVRIVDGIIVARNDDTNVTRILLPAS